MTADILPFATKKPVTPDPTFGAREALFAAVDELTLGQTSAKAVDKMTDYLLCRLIEDRQEDMTDLITEISGMLARLETIA